MNLTKTIQVVTKKQIREFIRFKDCTVSYSGTGRTMFVHGENAEAVTEEAKRAFPTSHYLIVAQPVKPTLIEMRAARKALILSKHATPATQTRVVAEGPAAPRKKSRVRSFLGL